MTTARWYWNRFRRMSLTEIAGRTRVAVRQSYWSKPKRRPSGADAFARSATGVVTVRLPQARARSVGLVSPAERAAVASADAVMAGNWPIFDVSRTDLPAEPNWFHDPFTGIEAPRKGYAFRLPYRDEGRVGNLKYVWEPSRHQTTTLLAVAWWLTGNADFAERVALHLTAWWRENPFLEGVHWISGIEVGLRLISWTWIRTLLADWDGCETLFDRNENFILQLYQHQRYLTEFCSRGSSANNHLIAELAGLACASVAFPFFKQSADWARWSHRRLVQEAARQTHSDGFNREQASDYHLFVFEMLLATSLATRLAGQPLGPELDEVLRRMADALAASLDAAGHPPRFGDGDDGRGVLLDAPSVEPVAGLLGAARSAVGEACWWPKTSDRATVFADIAAIVCGSTVAERRTPCPAVFEGSGNAILKAGDGPEEIWVRCDHGTLGYLSIAAHGHADALSVELRSGGVEVLADPGTYNYRNDPAWRRYFKGTAGHNTLAVDGEDQVEYGGTFLWLDGLTPTLENCKAGAGKPVQEWQARHDGYGRLSDPVVHHRRVVLDAAARGVILEDWIDAKQPHDVLLSFHLGPAVSAVLDGSAAILNWNYPQRPYGLSGRGLLSLPQALRWSLHKGETTPPLGWYSRGFGHREATITLVGRGKLAPGQRLVTGCEIYLPSTRLPEVSREEAWLAEPLAF